VINGGCGREMGAVLAILGEADDPELGDRLQRMLARSPYRGEPKFLVEGALANGIQSMGWDASLHSAGNWLVAFHGYVGNWGELAPVHGLRFPEDASNAHRIAMAYEALGDDLFVKVRGGGAVLIWNRREQALLAVRDVVGCRPMFQSDVAGRLFLASEIRQIFAGNNLDPTPSSDGLVAHLVRQPLTDGRTMFEDVTQVLPARVYRYSPTQRQIPSQTNVYWQPPSEKRIARRHLYRLADELHYLLERAVLRTLPDLPFACTLSGGMDSGSIWALVTDLAERGESAANLGRTVSLVFPGMESDESHLIRTHKWFPGGDPILIDASANQSVSHLGEMTHAVDFLPHPTLFGVGIVDAHARADCRRIVLDGIGGDEWFFGNFHYLFDLWRRGRLFICLLDCIRLSSPRRWGFRKTARALLPPSFSVRRMSSGPLPPPAWLHTAQHQLYRRLQRQLPFPSPEGASACSRELIGTLTFRQCDDGLLAIEQLSARNGVERRRPFMDLDLIDFAARSDGQAFTGGKRNKHLMRMAMQGIVPDEVVASTVMYGATEVVASGLPGYARQWLDHDWLLKELKILDEETLRRTLEIAISGNIDDAVHVYFILAAELFLQEHTLGRHPGVS